MASKPAEIAQEQKYFDVAWERREHSRATLRHAPDAAAGNNAQRRAVRAKSRERLEAMPDADEEVAIGRIDLETDQTFYLGRHAIWNEDQDLLVVEWQRPVVEGFYKATAASPKGVNRKRVFTTERNQIQDLVDTHFADLAARIDELTRDETLGIDDALLNDLAASRDGAMRDIVQTIHESQYDLIRRPLDELLVIQGGPGTGKTAVALHRVSWLLFNHRGELAPEDVLVVGPNKTFGRYIERVLPGLGNRGIAQRALTELGPVNSNRRPEDSDVARLKGDAPMAPFLERALHQRIRFPEKAKSIKIGTGARPLSLSEESITAALEPIRQSMSSYNTGRAAMRDWLTRTSREWSGRANTVDATAVDAALERVWPQLTPAAFLQDLLGSRPRITAAAGDDFLAGDIARLHRPAAPKLASETWSDSDVALLDEADRLINGKGTSYAHVVVDEAQDLSHMQIRSIRMRSSRGSCTLVGDIAQSTGAWARESWDDIVEAARQEYPVVQQDLRYGYRVPRQVMEIANALLEKIAPTLVPAEVIRSGPSAPTIQWADEQSLLDTAMEAARGYAADGYFVGVICSAATHPLLRAALKERGIVFSDAANGQLGASINLMTAEQSKGLEFDAVVVLEPAEIAGAGLPGLRELYIALTRTTTLLTVVHNESLPWQSSNSADGGITADALPLSELGAGSVHKPTDPGGDPQPVSEQGGTFREKTIRATAKFLADEIRGTLGPDAHAHLLVLLAEELEISRAEQG